MCAADAARTANRRPRNARWRLGRPSRHWRGMERPPTQNGVLMRPATAARVDGDDRDRGTKGVEACIGVPCARTQGDRGSVTLRLPLNLAIDPTPLFRALERRRVPIAHRAFCLVSSAGGGRRRLEATVTPEISYPPVPSDHLGDRGRGVGRAVARRVSSLG
jgi:hypothetical protein